MLDVIDTHQGLPHLIHRSNVFEDCPMLYTKKIEHILTEYPFRIEYASERAIVTGGVGRDMFSEFWECAYLKTFYRGNLLVPASHPNVQGWW